MTEDEILKRYGRGGILTHLPTKHEARMEVSAALAAGAVVGQPGDGRPRD